MSVQIYEHLPTRIEGREWRLSHLDQDMDMLVLWLKDHVAYYASILGKEKPLKGYFIQLKDHGICLYPGEWVIKDGEADIYSCNPNTFKKNYRLI